MNKILYLGIDPPKNQDKKAIIHCPLIQTIPRPPNDPDIRKAFLDLPEYSHVIFTSKNTVRVFFSYLEYHGLNALALKDKIFISVGRMTSEMINKQGFKVHITSREETSEGIVKELQHLSLKDAYIFWPHSAISRPLLSDYFNGSQIKFQECLLYDTHFKKPEVWPNLDEVSEIIFTSPSTVDAFIHFFGRIPQEKTLTPIGPVTADKLKKTIHLIN